MDDCFENTDANEYFSTNSNIVATCGRQLRRFIGLVTRGGGNAEVTSGTGGGAKASTWGQKPYIGDKCYNEMMDRSTYSYHINQFKQKKSQFDKPYLPGDYPEMEHFYPMLDPAPIGRPSYPNLPSIVDTEDEFWPSSPLRRAGFCGITCWGDSGKGPGYACDDVTGWCYPSPGTLGSSREWDVNGPVGDKIRTGKEIQNHLDLGGIEIVPDWDSITVVNNEKCATFKVRLTETVGSHKNRCRGEFELCCRDSGCACPADPAFAYASNPATIAQSGSETITVDNGCANFSWSVTGTGFSFTNATTTMGSNTLEAAADACGTASITVTDFCGTQVTGDVRCTEGSDWYSAVDCGTASGARCDTVSGGQWHWVFVGTGGPLTCGGGVDPECGDAWLEWSDCMGVFCCTGGNVLGDIDNDPESETYGQCISLLSTQRYRRYDWGCIP